MKKLFKLLSLLSFKDLRGHGHHHGGYRHGYHGHGHRYDGYGYHRSHSHYPLYGRRSFKKRIADRLIGRLLHGRRYY